VVHVQQLIHHHAAVGSRRHREKTSRRPPTSTPARAVQSIAVSSVRAGFRWSVGRSVGRPSDLDASPPPSVGLTERPPLLAAAISLDGTAPRPAPARRCPAAACGAARLRSAGVL